MVVVAQSISDASSQQSRDVGWVEEKVFIPTAGAICCIGQGNDHRLDIDRLVVQAGRGCRNRSPTGLAFCKHSGVIAPCFQNTVQIDFGGPDVSNRRGGGGRQVGRKGLEDQGVCGDDVTDNGLGRDSGCSAICAAEAHTGNNAALCSTFVDHLTWFDAQINGVEHDRA